MSQYVLPALLGSLVPLMVAILALIQNHRTLKASQPKIDAERLAAEAERVAAESAKQKSDIEALRAIIDALRQARDDDRLRFTEQLVQLHKDAADTKLQATGAHHEACEAHKQAQRAQRALHEQRVWWTTEDLPWHQAVLKLIASLDPDADVPPLPNPPSWDPPSVS